MSRLRSRDAESGDVNARRLARDAVTRESIARWAVGFDELAPGVVGRPHLAARAVGEANLAPEAVQVLRGDAHLLVMSATSASVADGGGPVTFSTIDAQHSFATVTEAGDSWVHPITAVYVLGYEHQWDSFKGGGTIELRVDGVTVATLASGTVGSRGRGSISYVATAGSVGELWVIQESGAAQECAGTVWVAVSDPTTPPPPPPPVPVAWGSSALLVEGEWHDPNTEAVEAGYGIAICAAGDGVWYAVTGSDMALGGAMGGQRVRAHRITSDGATMSVVSQIVADASDYYVENLAGLVVSSTGATDRLVVNLRVQTGAHTFDDRLAVLEWDGSTFTLGTPTGFTTGSLNGTVLVNTGADSGLWCTGSGLRRWTVAGMSVSFSGAVAGDFRGSLAGITPVQFNGTSFVPASVWIWRGATLTRLSLTGSVLTTITLSFPAFTRTLGLRVAGATEVIFTSLTVSDRDVIAQDVRIDMTDAALYDVQYGFGGVWGEDPAGSPSATITVPISDVHDAIVNLGLDTPGTLAGYDPGFEVGVPLPINPTPGGPNQVLSLLFQDMTYISEDPTLYVGMIGAVTIDEGGISTPTWSIYRTSSLQPTGDYFEDDLYAGALATSVGDGMAIVGSTRHLIRRPPIDEEHAYHAVVTALKALPYSDGGP